MATVSAVRVGNSMGSSSLGRRSEDFYFRVLLLKKK